MSDVPLVRTPEYEIRGEYLWFGVVLHSDVFVRWTKEVKGRFKVDLSNIVSQSVWPVYAFQSPSCDPLKQKFIESVGGTFEHSRQNDNGEMCRMYRFRSLGPIQRK
jgi:hypothetical protein